MGTEDSGGKAIDIHNISEVSLALKAIVQESGELGYLVHVLTDVEILKKDVKNFKEIEKDLQLAIARLEEKAPNLKDKMVSSTVQLALSGFTDAMKMFTAAFKDFDAKISDYKRFDGVLRSNPSNQDSLDEADRRHKKADAIISKTLYQMSEVLGGVQVLIQVFELYPALIPADLRIMEEGQLRGVVKSRVARYESFLSEQKQKVP